MPLFTSRGDGTVLTVSARYVTGTRYLINLWDQTGSERQKISHYNMTELSAVQDCVLRFLDGMTCHLSDTDTSQPFVTIGIHSPLTLVGHAEVLAFGDAEYVSYPMDGEEYESVWQGSASGSVEVSISIDGDKHLILPQPIFVASSTIVRISITGQHFGATHLIISYDYEGDGIYEYTQAYFVSGDRIRRDFSAEGGDNLGICSWLMPQHWLTCFFEGLFGHFSTSLIEQTLYDRNVLTGQRQEAVTGSESDP